MVGLRVAPVPFQLTRAAVNGYVGRSIAEKVEALAPAPSLLDFDLVAGELRLSDALARVEVERQSLEMSFGELTNDLTYHSPARDVKMSVVTFTPRQLPALACQEITLTADADLAVVLEPRLDPVGLPGRCLERIMPGSDVDAVLWWESHGGLSSLGAGFTTEIEGEDDYTSNQNNWGHESLLCLRQYRLRLRPGKPVRLRQYGALIPSTLRPESEAPAG